MMAFSSSHSQIQQDILLLLRPSFPVDTKVIALHYLVEMTGTAEGRRLIGHNSEVLSAVLQLVTDEDNAVKKEALLCLVNLTTDENIVISFMNLKHSELTLVKLLQFVLNPCCEQADAICSVLTNITRLPDCAHKVARLVLGQENGGLVKMVEALSNLNYNKHATLHYLSTLLMNLTQVSAVRQELLQNKSLLTVLLPFISFDASLVRRSGIVGIVNNCCFDYDYHEWLLGKEVDLLPKLLLPLAEPNIDDKEMELLPFDLQYLPATHVRETDPSVRNMIIQAITKLCSTKLGRKFCKERNVYIIFRELHKWEKNTENLNAIISLIDILIGDEPQEGMEDLHKVEIPIDLEKKLKEELHSRQDKNNMFLEKHFTLDV